MEFLPLLLIAGAAAYFGFKGFVAHTRRHLPPGPEERAALEAKKAWLEERRALARAQTWDAASVEKIETALGEIERRLSIAATP